MRHPITVIDFASRSFVIFSTTVLSISSSTAYAQSTSGPLAASDAPIKTLGVVTITASQPTSLPTQIPTTMEGVTRLQIEQTVNATDSEDALKYLPSLLVRKRYIGDYNHAILSTRASGTGNSARSMVYADGILLSNLLGNGVGGLSFPPRWGMVTPEEIERVDVMYGPFSAAYAGNSAGAVVDYVTRNPTKFEGHVSASYVEQPFTLYNTTATYRTWQTTASLGSKSGDWSWWVDATHSDAIGQPLTFATRLMSTGTPSTAGTVVTGAVRDANNADQAWYDIGTGTQFHSIQDQAKLKLAYDLTPTISARYTFGIWQNKSQGRPSSYLRDVNGQPVYSGAININGLAFAPLTGADFVSTNQESMHYMHGLSIKSHTQSTWDWELTASQYRYSSDSLRQNAASNPPPTSATTGTGTIADGSGTGWMTLAARGTWRPDGMTGAHIVDAGIQQDSYKLRFMTSSILGNWISDGAGSLVSNVSGNTQLQSLWGQDSWRLSPLWKTVLGLRVERWTTDHGLTEFSASSSQAFPSRAMLALSPKGALSYQAMSDLVIKGSIGRAVRFPTVSELYGATSTTNSQYINDPHLQPEKSWTTELSAEKDMGNAFLRATFFTEDVHDALYTQSLLDTTLNKTISRVQNIGRIQTQGIELAYGGNDVYFKGLDLNSSLTYTRSIIKNNAGFVTSPGDTIGKWQPNIPPWRAAVQASYHMNDAWSASLGVRYSGKQYRTLNNADTNGYTYMGVSPYLTADVRVVWKPSHRLSVAAGIENLNNDKYWNFHPYPQRSYFMNAKANF